MTRYRQFVPAILWMCVIFVFSTSLFGGENTGSIFKWLVSSIFPAMPLPDIEYAHNVVRKAGHLTEYAVLALLWRRGFVREGFSGAKAVVVALVISACYAVTDEFHQSFVPNRTASALDVLIDASGAVLGQAVYALGQKKRRL